MRCTTRARPDGLSLLSATENSRSSCFLLGQDSLLRDGQLFLERARQREHALLDDPRLYRLAAEDRGLDALAGVMKDLELVLLQTSLTDGKDPSALPQLQRLIKRRDLIEKMDVVTTTGL